MTCTTINFGSGLRKELVPQAVSGFGGFRVLGFRVKV